MDSTCCNFFSDSTGLYFYSAVFQGNMALLALLGVFIVLRFQRFESIRDDVDSFYLSAMKSAFKIVESMIKEKVPTLDLKPLQCEAKSAVYRKQNEYRLNWQRQLDEERTRFLKKAMKPIWITSTTSLHSLFLLTVSHFIHKIHDNRRAVSVSYSCSFDCFALPQYSFCARGRN